VNGRRVGEAIGTGCAVLIAIAGTVVLIAVVWWVWVALV